MGDRRSAEPAGECGEPFFPAEFYALLTNALVSTEVCYGKLEQGAKGQPRQGFQTEVYDLY